MLIELKLEEFSHENIGQLNTYVSWYDKNMKTERDNPPVGILLCTQKDHALVEYALAGMDNQLFVYKIPASLAGPRAVGTGAGALAQGGSMIPRQPQGLEGRVEHHGTS